MGEEKSMRSERWQELEAVVQLWLLKSEWMLIVVWRNACCVHSVCVFVLSILFVSLSASRLLQSKQILLQLPLTCRIINDLNFKFTIFFIRGVRLIVPHCWSEQFHFTMNDEFEWSLKGSIRPAFSVISKPMFAPWLWHVHNNRWILSLLSI